MAEKRYTKNGEWVSRWGDSWRVGLSAAAVEELGEVTFVELPAPGRFLSPGEAVCAVEAVKAAADYYSPLEGTISAVNESLAVEPNLLNTSPESEGWIFAVRGVPEESLSGLLDEESWKKWEAGR